MAPHSSTLAWKIPWMEEPGGLQSMGLLRVGRDWATSLWLFTFSIGEGNGNPLQYSCLENARDGGAWWAAVYGVTQSRTPPKRLSSSYNSVERYNFVERYKFAWPFLCKFLSIPLLFTPLSKVLFTLKLSIYLLMYLLSPSTLSLQLMKTLAPWEQRFCLFCSLFL